MKYKEDARVIKTKNALLKALLSLMAEKKYADISINEMCTTAGIRRATFYKHFSDKDDFLISVLKRLREMFEEKKWNNKITDNPKDYFISYCEAVVNFFYNRKELCEIILADDSGSRIIGMMIYQNYLDTKERLEQSIDKITPVASTHTVAGMMAGGIGMLLVKWASEGWTTPKEDVIADISLAINSLI